MTINRLGLADLKAALRAGLDDFNAMPTHAMFVAAIYPIVGLLLGRLAFGYSVLALVGPLAALGLYELSRRREAGLPVSAAHALDVVQSSSIGGLIALGFLLLVIFGLWIAFANAIYIADFGYAPPKSIVGFLRNVFTTPAGWNLIVVGNLVGFLLAVAVLIISTVSFPMLLDRDVGAAGALATSIRVVAKNPLTMAVWGLIVAALLLIGSLPLLLGLTVVMPVLGHATLASLSTGGVVRGQPASDPAPDAA